MSDTNMSQEQFQQIMQRFDANDVRMKNVEDNMVRKGDLFQAVLTVQGLVLAIIVGTLVVANALVGFGGPTP
ncbi:MULTISPECIES: hypothetical protein [Roseobacteraceae]|uniref:hypothetical protein n=1 Tax=Roseobacteraceae TaxID=2854170 RepID=UPI0022C7D618|nr:MULTISPECIES: hypothetical protein [Roseobacteraceae]MCZ4354716.1 hypothetical protein [Roseovarius aestuarii]